MLLGRYELADVLARAERGATYRAVLCGDGGFQRTSTVVVLDSQDPMVVAEFIEATKATAALGHPNIARVFDLGVEDGRVYYARERVEGISLDQLLARSRATGEALPAELAMYICLRILEGLAHAHRAPVGVIHRALRLENVIVGVHGDVKLIGFGGEALLACEVGEAPELATGHEHDKRTNVFDVAGLIAAIVAPEHRSPALSAVLSRARAAHRGARFSGAGELFTAVRAIANDLGLVTTSYRVAAWMRDSAEPPRRRLARGSSPTRPAARDEPAVASGLDGSIEDVALPGCWKNALILLAISLLLFATSLTLTIALD